jgi:cob(I)alamin adenosyltransferase
MKIYTKSGDTGQTGLFGPERVPKTDLRISAMGALDELNAAIGLARTSQLADESDRILSRAQHLLFDMGAEFASTKGEFQAIQPRAIESLEKGIDSMEESLEPLKSFVLPGGTLQAAHLHLARTACRRAEREVLRLHEEFPVQPNSLQYLNRLSDWLFVAARYANFVEGQSDVLWQKFDTE